MNTLARCEDHKIKIDCYSAGKLFVSCRKCKYKAWCYVQQFDTVLLLQPVLQPLLMPLLVHPVKPDPFTVHIVDVVNQDVMRNFAISNNSASSIV